VRMFDLPFVQISYNKGSSTPHDREQFLGWWQASGVWRPTGARSIFGLHLQTCALYSCNLKESYDMKEPGLDGRHRDKDGEIQQKRSDTLNKNLSKPIPQFSPNATLGKMREATGKVSEAAVRRAAAKLQK
jgi:hypothetical protein